MAEFKVGDRVRFVGELGQKPHLTNHTGTVRTITNTRDAQYPYGVLMDDTETETHLLPIYCAGYELSLLHKKVQEEKAEGLFRKAANWLKETFNG